MRAQLVCSTEAAAQCSAAIAASRWYWGLVASAAQAMI
jgi:hypothetical protein